MDKLLSDLSNAPNIEFPQILVFFVIVVTAVAIKNAFWCIYKITLSILSFIYAVLCIKPNCKLHENDKASLPPLAVNWSTDSSQEADKKTSKFVTIRKAKPKSEKSDTVSEDSS